MAELATAVRKEWHVCPGCKGEGVKIVADPRAPWKRSKELCPQCNGNRMVQFAVDSKESMLNAPVRQCPKCKNWYAIGAGHGPDELNDPLRVAPNPNAHSHWHDMSFYPPPSTTDSLPQASPVQTESPTVTPMDEMRAELERLRAQVATLQMERLQAQVDALQTTTTPQPGVVPPETRANISRAAKAAWQRRKAKAAREKAAVPA